MVCHDQITSANEQNEHNRVGATQAGNATTNGGSEFSNQVKKLCVSSCKALQVSQQDASNSNK
jgi:hypothetical protein